MKLFILLPVLLFSLCSWSGKEQKTVKASGSIVTEQRSVKVFTAIAVSQEINLYLTPGEDHSISVKTDDNILPYLKTEVQGNTLIIYFSEDIQIKSPRSSEVYVTLPQLEKLTVSTGAMIKSTQLIQAKSIDLKASTSGAPLPSDHNHLLLQLHRKDAFPDMPVLSYRRESDIVGRHLPAQFLLSALQV